MKKLITLCTLLLCAVVTAWADDAGSITITWPMVDATNALSQSGTASVADVVSVNDASLSGSLEWNGSRKLQYSYSGGSYGETFYAGGIKNNQSNTKDNETVSTGYVAFSFTIPEGVTFVPTNYSFKAGRQGTDNGCIQGSLSYTQETTAKTATTSVYQPARTDKTDANVESNPISVDITGADAFVEGNIVTLKIYFGGKNKGKTIYIADVKITGNYTKAVLTTFELTTEVNPAESGTVARTPDATSYTAGKSVTLTATPNYGYVFTNWTKGGSEVSTSATYEFTTAAQAETYVANFSKLPMYDLTITAGSGGNVSKSPNHDSYLVGEEVTLTATPNNGYAFVNWTKGGLEVSTNASYVVTTAAEAAEYVATFKKLKSVNYSVGEGDKGTTTKILTTEYYDAGDSYVVPNNYYIVKDGYTFKGWTDGVSTYQPNDIIIVSEDFTLTPIFVANTSEIGDQTVDVDWTFAPNSGAPTLNVENATGYYVKHMKVGGAALDIPMYINTVKNEVLSGSTGKLNNVGQTTRAQVNKGTAFTIPAFAGMTIKYTTTNGTPKITDNVLFGEDHATSIDGKSFVYAYTGSATSLTISDNVGGFYPSGITVSYPTRPTKCPMPTITIGDFNFEHGGYKVTIASGNKLWVSNDGTNYTEQTSPYENYVTATTTFYAKSTGDGLEDSEVASQEVTNTFDPAKPYIAWVHEPSYENKNKNYDIASDKLVEGLKADNNVVLVGYTSGATPSEDLKNADLVVLSEAVTGSGAMAIAFKDFVGAVPMLNMKLFAYTYSSTASKNRWGWGTPKNPGSSNTAIVPTSKTYKLLDGVSIETDGSVKLYDGSEDLNHIQTVSSWDDEPEGDIVMGKANDEVAMHASKSLKFFGIGLSCDDYANYSTNAVTIVKNAAAMLIAGEALDAEVATVSGEISVSGFNTFSSSYPLDLSTITNATAYVASAVEGDKVELVKTTDKVAAGEGLFLAGTVGETFTIGVTTEAATLTADNKLVGLPAGGTVPAGVGKYVFAWPTSDPSAASFYIVETTPATLGAGKAYLDTAAAGDARLSLSFGEDAGEATGISEMKSQKADGTIFNLRGQRVAQPQKGLYIMNGKKTIVK